MSYNYRAFFICKSLLDFWIRWEARRTSVKPSFKYLDSKILNTFPISLPKLLSKIFFMNPGEMYVLDFWKFFSTKSTKSSNSVEIFKTLIKLSHCDWKR